MRIILMIAVVLLPASVMADGAVRLRVGTKVEPTVNVRVLPVKERWVRPRGRRRQGHGHKRATIVYERTTSPEAPSEPAPPAAVPVRIDAADTTVDRPVPEGEIRFRRPRNVSVEKPRWVVGEPLPPRLPLVSLDPVTYGLPELPAGQIYVRIRRTVLVIEAGSRRVVRQFSS